MPRSPRTPGYSLVEVMISLAIVVLLLAILLPSLNQARSTSRRLKCVANLQRLGQAWNQYLTDHNNRFPYLAIDPAWGYAGVHFDRRGEPLRLNPNRPLSPYLPSVRGDRPWLHPLYCPGDCGITGKTGLSGTGSRTCFRAYGASYRANSIFFQPSRPSKKWTPDQTEAASKSLLTGSSAAEITPASPVRGISREKITTPPSSLLLLGDPLWFEVAEETGRNAQWHDKDRLGNLLFLDGSVRSLLLRPKRVIGPVRYDPFGID